MKGTVKHSKGWKANLMVWILENKTPGPFNMQTSLCRFQKTSQYLYTHINNKSIIIHLLNCMLEHRNSSKKPQLQTYIGMNSNLLVVSLQGSAFAILIPNLKNKKQFCIYFVVFDWNA